MGFGESISTGFRKYVRTGGRASRSEFWYWTLFTVLVTIAADIADAGIAAAAHTSNLGLVGGVLGFALLLPGIAVTIRRLHDTNHAGWWMLLPITVIGLIPYLIWLCSRGTPGANRFGLGTDAAIAEVFGDGPAYGAAPTSQGVPSVVAEVHPSAAERGTGTPLTLR